MERIIEPELMEGEEQSLAYAEADFEQPHSYFIKLFQEKFGNDIGNTVLDLGCGTGDITLRGEILHEYINTNILNDFK